MKSLLEDIINESKSLPMIQLKAATAYHSFGKQLTRFVDEKMASQADITDLIGNNPLQIMYDNHKHHCAFMSTVFIINNYELLARTIPWVYRAYTCHNFSYEYFPRQLNVWCDAVKRFLGDDCDDILAVYSWMIKKHRQMIELSNDETLSACPVKEDWLEVKNQFQQAVLIGDHRACVLLAENSVTTPDDIEPFFLHIIQPVMVEIGMLWERNKISVAQEHLASAIVTRVMATINQFIKADKLTVGKAVVTTAPNEFHEIGAWMIADSLENNGWEVRYLGANTPYDDLVSYLKSFQPNILALSVTMPFNILQTIKMIRGIKKSDDFNSLKIMVGGRVFNENPELWRSTGADTFAGNLESCVQKANEWKQHE